MTKLDLGPEMHVEALRKEHVLERVREQGKVPAGAERFCLRVLWTKLSRMFLLRRKEIKGLSEKIEDVSGSFFRDIIRRNFHIFIFQPRYVNNDIKSTYVVDMGAWRCLRWSIIVAVKLLP